MNFLFIGGMLAVMYFFFIRPQSQKVKKEKEFVDALKKGDKVVTTAGIHGTVDRVEDDAIILEIAKDVKIKVAKAGISGEMSQTSAK